MAITWLLCASLGCGCASAFAQSADAPVAAPQPDAAAADGETKKPDKRSPWLATPVFQSNPKLGTSLGALVGYLHYFDPASRPSMFAVMGQYTTTESTIGGAFARTSFDEDHQRLLAGLMYGYVKNDYGDYLGTGVPLRSNGDLRSFIARYTYRIVGDVFIGAQGVYQNMAVTGETQFDDDFLDLVGVRPYTSGGAGLVAQYDSRDSENLPTRGWLLNLNNIAYREWLAGEDDFDVVRADIRWFWSHGDGHVLAIRELNHFTADAPTQVRAPVQLRGYKLGQFNGQHMSQIEAEERLRLGSRFTATLFAGVAATYGSGTGESTSDDLFPAGGAGVQYILKPKEGVVLNLEYAQGKDANYGVYLKLGYTF